MRIRVENGTHCLHNYGDIAMLGAAIERLGALWPEATLEVVTDRPDRLLACFPGVQPVPASSRFWHTLDSMTPGMTETLLRRAPHLATLSSRAIRRLLRGRERPEAGMGEKRLAETDLVVASGGGYLTDHFADFCLPMLDRLDTALHLGKPIALMGQGIGPVRCVPLFARLKGILPEARLLALREDRASPSLLDAWRVPRAKRMVTGDDAIELAYRYRAKNPGNSLGVNLRQVYYTEVSDGEILLLRETLQRTARRLGAKMLPIPIALSQHESDATTTLRLLAETPAVADREEFSLDWLLKRVACCRVVVTGSYHAAVFALSQGLPAVCLAKSAYYADKFLGLQHQFGPGCEVIPMNAESYSCRLAEAIVHLWEEAETLRPGLLSAACQQIEASRLAYQRLYKFVTSGAQAADDRQD